MQIKSITLFRVKLPLIEPYRLSYGDISCLHSLWTRISLDNGHVGWGESTPLFGYTSANIDSVIDSSVQIAHQWIQCPVDAIISKPLAHRDGFLFTALWTALEDALGRFEHKIGEVPIVGIVQEENNESLVDALQRARGKGYRTFKVKVGYANDIATEKTRIETLQKELGPNETLRIDANQSLLRRDGLLLAESCLPEKVQLFEQPYPVQAWEDTEYLAKHSPVPIMLDESITNLGSLDKAADHGARYVKLKWMKQGGQYYLENMVRHAKKLGLGIIMGNGVATWLNNYYEAVFWLHYLMKDKLAGEMNGFLKVCKEQRLMKYKEGSIHIGQRHQNIDNIIEPSFAERILLLTS